MRSTSYQIEKKDIYAFIKNNYFLLHIKALLDHSQTVMGP